MDFSTTFAAVECLLDTDETMRNGDCCDTLQ